jgi:hypothetical protein
MSDEENQARKFALGREARGDRNGSRLHPERLARGESHGNALLTEEKVIEMRRRRSLGETMQALGKVFGVSKSTAQAVCSGRNWAIKKDPVKK